LETINSLQNTDQYGYTDKINWSWVLVIAAGLVLVSVRGIEPKDQNQ